MKENELENLGRLPRKDRHLISRVLSHFDRHEISFMFYTHICERGHDDKLLLTADWNRTTDGLYDFLERNFGHALALGWSDEWTQCDNCIGAIRQHADGFHWMPSFMEIDDYAICQHCYSVRATDIISAFVDEPEKVVMPEFVSCLKEAGFRCMTAEDPAVCHQFYTGLHADMNDDPVKVYNELKVLLPNYDIIFQLESTSQFHIKWCVWLRKGGQHNA